MPNYDLALRVATLRAKINLAVAALEMSGSLADPYVAEAYQALAADPNSEDPDGPARDVTGVGVLGTDGRINGLQSIVRLVVPEGRSMAEASNDQAVLLREVMTLRGKVGNHAREITRAKETIRAQAQEIAVLRGRLQQRALDSGAPPIIGGEVTREARTAFATLPPRRKEVALLAAAGLTMPQIAERLHLTRNTVKTHMQMLYRDLGVTKRTELTLLVQGTQREERAS